MAAELAGSGKRFRRPGGVSGAGRERGERGESGDFIKG
jgi:hypothetical protein